MKKTGRLSSKRIKWIVIFILKISISSISNILAQQLDATSLLSGGEISYEFIQTVGNDKIKYRINIYDDWLLCHDEFEQKEFLGIFSAAYVKQIDAAGNL